MKTLDELIERFKLSKFEKQSKDFPEAVCFISEETARVLFSSARLDEMFGYGPDELQHEDHMLVTFPGFYDKSVTSDIAVKVAKTGTWEGEVTYLNKNAEEFKGKTTIGAFDIAENETIWIVLIAQVPITG